MTEEERFKLGVAIQREREKRGWGKEEAARNAGISSITWKRAEDGLKIQQHKMAAVMATLGWGYGSDANLARDREPILDPTWAARRRGRPMFFRDDGTTDEDLSLGFQSVTAFATLARSRGGSSALASYLIQDAVMLVDSIAMAQEARGIDLTDAHHHHDDYDLAAREGDVPEHPGLANQASAGQEHQGEAPEGGA